MRILITGGLGFIGSHIIVELIENNHSVVIIDNLINSQSSVLGHIQTITKQKPIFLKIDLLNKPELEAIFMMWKFDCVIHLGGLKSVPESIKNPLIYYQTNLMSTLNLLELMVKYQVKNLIFSSSATVYGSSSSPMTEQSQTGLGITNPYGKSKYMQEEIIKDFQSANSEWSVIILRYFNPIGAHSSGLLSENPNNTPNNLLPYLLRVADGSYPILNIYGSDYDTPDGTCIRDFVHVVDLAKGHVIALKLLNDPGVHIYNLGTGHGQSVKEVINTFQNITGVELELKWTDRRPGDLSVCYADVSKVAKELGWKAESNLEDMCRDSWIAHQMQKIDFSTDSKNNINTQFDMELVNDKV
jgi:UDP-glucose 4-epimerase